MPMNAPGFQPADALDTNITLARITGAIARGKAHVTTIYSAKGTDSSASKTSTAAGTSQKETLFFKRKGY